MATDRIGYRCSACGSATLGILCGVAKLSDMLRIKCSCKESALDVQKKKDGGLHLSVPCVYCRGNHGYNISDFEKRADTVKLPCPFSNMDIAFIGDEEGVSRELDRTAEELSRVIASFEGETLSDIQPTDTDEGEICDPRLFDTVNFIVRDLEADGAVSCPCKSTKVGIRFTDDGIQAFCETCGASYTFYAKSEAMAESYLSLDKIELT